MEKAKKVQGRGFIVLNGQVFSRNMESGTLPRMDKRIVADLAEKGIHVERLNFAQSQDNEVVARHEEEEVKSTAARRNLER